MLTLETDIKAYVKKYNICLALKIVRKKFYRDPQSLLILKH